MASEEGIGPRDPVSRGLLLPYAAALSGDALKITKTALRLEAVYMDLLLYLYRGPARQCSSETEYRWRRLGLKQLW